MKGSPKGKRELSWNFPIKAGSRILPTPNQTNAYFKSLSDSSPFGQIEIKLMVDQQSISRVLNTLHKSPSRLPPSNFTKS